MKSTKLLKDIVIIFGITLSIFVVSEIILRIIFPEKSIAYEFNEDYLVSLKPNIIKDFPRSKVNGGYISRWKSNNNSFRGLSLQDNPKYRIIVYGDSNIQARFSGIARTYPGQIARYLSEKGRPDVEIVNAGVVGFGPDQSLIRFEKEVDEYKPNLVIFHVFADNDFGDIIRNRLFDLDTNGNLISTHHRRTSDQYLFDKTFLSHLLTVRAANKLINSLVGEKSSEEPKDEKNRKGEKERNRENLVKRLQKLGGEEYLVYKNSKARKFSHFADHYDIDIALNPYSESSQVKIRLMEKVLEEANKIALRKDIKLLVLIQPSVIDLTKNNAVLSYEYLKKYTSYKRKNLTDAVKRICALHNIHSINLFDVFVDNNPEDLYFRAGDDHWNDQGQKKAAKETVQYLIQHSMIDNE